jgi:hypothetical protein
MFSTTAAPRRPPKGYIMVFRDFEIALALRKRSAEEGARLASTQITEPYSKSLTPNSKIDE